MLKKYALIRIVSTLARAISVAYINYGIIFEYFFQKEINFLLQLSPFVALRVELIDLISLCSFKSYLQYVFLVFLHFFETPYHAVAVQTNILHKKNATRTI